MNKPFEIGNDLDCLRYPASGVTEHAFTTRKIFFFVKGLSGFLGKALIFGA
jgi:hypothetical protein